MFYKWPNTTNVYAVVLTFVLPEGTSANSLNFQLYFLEGLNRWNQDRQAASLTVKPPSMLSYSGDLVHCVNTRCQGAWKEAGPFFSATCFLHWLVAAFHHDEANFEAFVKANFPLSVIFLSVPGELIGTYSIRQERPYRLYILRKLIRCWRMSKLRKS